MSCKNVCRLCPSLIISESVLFDPTTNSLDITIPNNSYRSGDKVCIVVAQSIPSSTTINALVYIVVNGVRFPLQKCNCVQAVASEIKSRTKYSTRVVTNTVSGAFRLLGTINFCSQPDNLISLPVDTTATTLSVASVEPVVVKTRTVKKEATANE